MDLESKLSQNEAPQLQLLSVVIPARDEEGCIASTVEHLHVELRLNRVPHEIVVVDDGSSDRTWQILLELRQRISELRPIQNSGPHGFGRAVTLGLHQMTGDAVVIMMADESDDCRDVVRYWKKLNEGWDCVFGSRFVKGGGTIDYPWLKLQVNRLANTFLRFLFNIGLNDTTNAFKAYRKTVVEGCEPLIAPHFNLTVEIPLKAIVRGYSWTVIPITWRNRRVGEAKLKIKEMGSRYLFICLYVWLEKYFSRGDYRRSDSALVSRSVVAVPDRDPSAPRQILVDLTSIAENDLGTGIQRVVRAILQSMLDDPPSDYVVEPVCFLKDKGYVYTRLGNEVPERLPKDEPVSVSEGDFFLGLDLCPQISGMLPWLEAYKNKGARLAFVVYDLLPLLKPHLFDQAVASAVLGWFKTVSEIADGLVCISRTVADEVYEWLNRERGTIQRMRNLPIGVFHLGADFCPGRPAPPKQAPGPSGFLLVGTIEPRKGHPQALAAMELLWSEGIQASLVFCGKKGWMVDDFVRKIQGHPELNRRLFWFEAATDETLESLYTNSRALLVPSIGEGFGLPLVEAARFQLPLILRDLPVFREVAGEHAYYFQGETPEALARALRTWLSLGNSVPTSAGMKWLTWRESRQQLLATFLNNRWYRVWPDAGKCDRSGETLGTRRIVSVSPSTPQLP